MRFTAVAPFLLLLTLFACSNPKKPSDANFKTAIQASLDKRPVCIVAPVPAQRANVNGAQQPDAMLDSLVRAGLVSATPATVVENDFLSGSSKVQGVKYNLTEEGKKFVTTAKLTAAMALLGPSSSLCYAKKQVVSIVRYSEPSSALGQTVSEVTYTYKLTGVADWARDAAIQKAFLIGGHLEADAAPVEDKTVLVLMNDGWRVPEM